MEIIDKILNYVDIFMPVFNILLYVIICIPFLYQSLKGIEKGYKITMWRLLVRLVYLLVFILTLNLVANYLFLSENLFNLPSWLESQIYRTSSDTTVTFKDLSGVIVDNTISGLGTEVNIDGAYLRGLVDSLVLYALKIVYMVLYFLILVPVFKFIMLIIFSIFFKGRKLFRNFNKDPLLGFFCGLLNGATKAFVIMVFMGGFFSLIGYSGEIKHLNEEVNNTDSSSETVTTTEALSYNNSSFDIILLDEGEGDGEAGLPIGLDEVTPFIKYAGKILDRLVQINFCWSDNVIVKATKCVYVEDENGEKVDVLTRVFDDIIYMEYTIDQSTNGSTHEEDELENTSLNLLDNEEEEYQPLKYKINFVSEFNRLLNAVFYIIDNDDLISDEGEIDFKKLDGGRIEEAFNNLSDLELPKIFVAIGIDTLIGYLEESSDSLHMTESEKNQLLSADFTGDISKLGKFIGGLCDLGLGYFIDDMIDGGSIASEEGFNIDKILDIFRGYKATGETDDEFSQRVTQARNKIINSLSDLEIIKKGTKILTNYLFNGMLKDTLSEFGLDEENINIPDEDRNDPNYERKTYIESIINTIDLSSDIGKMVEMLFDVADYNNGEGKLMDSINSFFNFTGEGGSGSSSSSIDADEFAEFINVSIIGKFGRMSIIQVGMDCAVKILLNTLSQDEENTFSKYLSEENIFHSYIDWGDEIGVKIPNVVTAIIQSDFISLFFSGGETNIMDQLWAKDSLKALLEPSINALFSLKLLANLEDTCLKPLIDDLLQSFSTEGFSIEVGDKLGQEGHRIGDELLLFLGIFDDMIGAAKESGCTSISDLTSNMDYIINGIAAVDGVDLEKSQIFGPTVVGLLTSFETDMLVVPYISKDPNWYTTFNDEGEVVKYGELYNIVNAIGACKDLIIDIINSTTSGEGSGVDTIINIIKSIHDEEIERLFSSVTLQATITKLLNQFSSGEGGFSISIPKTSQTMMTVEISNYDPADTSLVASGNSFEYTVLNEAGEEETVVVNQMYSDYINKNELIRFVHALIQVGDITQLMDSSNMVQTIKNLNGDAIDGLEHEGVDALPYSSWLYVEGTSTFKSKIDILCECTTLRCTISNFLTGEDFNSEFFKIPDDTVELLDGKYYIKENELSNLFESIISVVEATNINNLSSLDSSVMSKIVNMRDSSIDKIFDSTILSTTFSSLITSLNTLELPIIDVEGYKPVIETSIISGINVDNSLLSKTAYAINKEEFKAMLRSIKILFPNGFDLSDSSSFDISNILGNLLELGYEANKPGSVGRRLNQFFSSYILKATLSKYLMALADTFIIPENSLDTTYQRLSYDSGTSTYSVEDSITLTTDECKNIIKALEKIFPYKKGGLGGDSFGDLDFGNILGNIMSLSENDLNVLFGSNILRATMSDAILKIEAIIVPSTVAVNEKYLVKDSSDNYELSLLTKPVITKEADIDLIVSLSYIFPDSIDLSGINESIITDLLGLSEHDLNELFASSILRATISDKIMNGGSAGSALVVPFTYNDGESHTVSELINKLYNDGDNYLTSPTYIIEQVDLVNLVKAIRLIFGDSFDISSIGFSTFKQLSSLSNEDINTITSSVILNATISDKLSDAFSGGGSTEIVIPSSVLIPYRDMTNTSEDVYMISGGEIAKLIKSMGYFDFENMADSSSSFTALKQLTKTTTSGRQQIEIILDSDVLKATVSSILLTMNMGMDVIVPDTLNIVSPSNKVYKLSMETKKYAVSDDNLCTIINGNEIVNLVNAINFIDTSSLSGSGDGAFNTLKDLLGFVSLNSADRKIDVVLDSLILRATISNYLMSMSTTSFEILVPFNALTLESNDLDEPILYTNLSEVENHQVNAYIIKSSELKQFIIGIASLDIDKLSSDQANAIKNFKNASSYDNDVSNIEQIANSQILRFTISNYLFKEASNIGFNAISFPNNDMLGNQYALKYNSLSKTFSHDTSKYYIKTYTIGLETVDELVNFVNALSYIDIQNIASDTLNAISQLKYNAPGEANPKIDEILKSDILRYTLSEQILSFAIDGGNWRFIIPNESFENTLGVINKYQVLNYSSSTFDEIELIKVYDIKQLINSLDILDLGNLTADELLGLSTEDMAELLSCTIFRANISNAFVTAIETNDNINSYNPLDDALGNEITYKSTPSANDAHETVLYQELMDIIESMSILGANNLGSFNISLDTLTNFSDDDQGLTTIEDYIDDDDNRANDVNDDRARFLRSIFIRNIISGIMHSASRLEVSSIAKSVDDTYRTFGGQVTCSDLNSLTFNELTKTLSWKRADDATPVEFYGSPIPSTQAYKIIINGDIDNPIIVAHPASGDYVTKDLSLELAGVGVYNIKVIATAETIVLGDSYPTHKSVSYRTINSESSLKYVNSSSLSQVSDATITTIGDKDFLEFTKISNANSYTIKFYDSTDDSLIFSQNINSKSNVKFGISDLFEAGSYYYTIKASSKNEAYLDSPVFSSLSNLLDSDKYYLVDTTLSPVSIELIGNELIFSDVDDSNDYVVTVDSNPINIFEHFNSVVLYEDPNDLSSRSYTRYSLDLGSSAVEALFTTGSHTVRINAINTTNANIHESTNTIVINKLDNVSSIALKDDGTQILINKVANATKYLVTIKRIEGLSEIEQLYTEIEPTEAPMVSVSTSPLYKGFRYKVIVEPIMISGNYLSESYEDIITYKNKLSTASHHMISDDLILEFRHDENATSYDINLYKYNSGTEVFDLVDTKTTNSYIVDLATLFSDYTFNKDSKYKVTVVSKSSNPIYDDSNESIGKEFSLTNLDRISEVELIENIEGEILVSFSAIEHAYSYRIEIRKEVITEGVSSYDIFDEFHVLLTSEHLSIEDGVVTINIDEARNEIEYEESEGKEIAYRITIYAEASPLQSAYIESKASTQVEFYK